MRDNQGRAGVTEATGKTASTTPIVEGWGLHWAGSICPREPGGSSSPSRQCLYHWATLALGSLPFQASVSLWAIGLTVIDHGHPRVQLALVEHSVKVTALDLAERGAAGGAGLQVAQAKALPFTHAVFALVFGPVGRVG